MLVDMLWRIRELNKLLDARTVIKIRFSLRAFLVASAVTSLVVGISYRVVSGAITAGNAGALVWPCFIVAAVAPFIGCYLGFRCSPKHASVGAERKRNESLEVDKRKRFLTIH